MRGGAERWAPPPACQALGGAALSPKGHLRLTLETSTTLQVWNFLECSLCLGDICLLFQNHPLAILSLEIPKASGQNQVFFPDTGSQEALPHWVTWYGLSCVPPRIPVLKLQPPGESV